MSGVEEELVQALSRVLLQDEQVDGLDEDLVSYISGMLASKVHEDEGKELALVQKEVEEEVLNPFLESVQCPDHLTQSAQNAVRDVFAKYIASSASSTNDASESKTTRKLTQGIVSMFSDLDRTNEHEADANRYLWGTSTGVKAMANDLIDAQTDKSSARDKRKARKADAEKARKLLSSNKDEDIDGSSGGALVRMNFRTVTGNMAADKARDVQVRNVTLSLDNGTVLLEAGELKFAYQRRYGLIGENGVGT